MKLNIQLFSGGSYNYSYSYLDIYEDKVYDEELNSMLKDLRKVLHDLEWWQSDDIGKEDYRKTLEEFKAKWFKNKDTIKQVKIDTIKRKLEESLKMLEGK